MVRSGQPLEDVGGLVLEWHQQSELGLQISVHRLSRTDG